MDGSKYQPDEKMNAFSKWIIDNATGLDAQSLSPFQETIINGQAILMIMLFIIIVLK